MGIAYDYRCKKCDTEFVTVVKFEDRDIVQECPHCGPGSIGTRFYGRVNFTKASVVDGQKRPGFEQLKIDAKLRAAAMDAEDRGSIDDAREITKERAERDKKD